MERGDSGLVVTQKIGNMYLFQIIASRKPT
jgi:hypothetical protein